MDLTHYLGFGGVNLLSSARANLHCNLETLRLNDCGLTDEGCGALASALTSKLSHLRELDLSGNKLGDLGMMMLRAGLENNFSKLGMLILNDCGITYEGCGSLASALASNSSHLRELDLSMNTLNHLEMLLLSAGLGNPYCKLEKLKLVSCGLTDGCADLASALRSNPSHLRELDLSENSLSYLDTMMLSAVMENPFWKLKTLKLVNCGFTDGSCVTLMSALRSNPSHLRKLDLSKNTIDYLEMMVLSSAMENPYWTLETLKLKQCDLTDEVCAALATALRSNPSHLRELDLSENKLGDFGVQMLCIVLEMPYCKLETLKLVSCDITDNCCVTLVSALSSNPSHLRNLDLSGNKLGYLGIKLLSDALKNPYCKLETLKLNDCDLTDEDCVSLASALRLKPSNLRELDLSENKLGDSAVKLLFAGPECHLSKLRTLKLVNCGITGDGCAALASALRTHLRELDLTGNNVEDSGVNMLADGMQNHSCQLETLMLVSCGFTDEGCAALASALTSNSSKLREVDLSKNKLSDSGMKLLSAGLENPHCELEVLRLNDCEVSDEGCRALASALTSNPSHLRELDLSDNKLGDFGVKMLCAGLKDPCCKLEILKLKHCGFTDEGCAALASVLGSDHSYLKYVDLSVNTLGDFGVQLLSAGFY